MSEPWTPGPWWGEDFRVAHGHGEDMEDVVWEVATGPHGEANTRLISLAPEMAELLEQVADISDAGEMCPNCVTPWKCNGPHIPLYERARDLLTRARG